MSADLTFNIRGGAFDKAWRDAPKKLNGGMNVSLKRAGGEFGKLFTRSRLGAAGIRIRKKAVVKKAEKNAPSLPKKMRLAGFRGEMRRMGRIEGKAVIVRTRNPVMVAHEFGAVIKPRRAGALKIPFSTQPKGLSREDRKAAFLLPGRAVLVVPTKTKGGKSKLRAIAHLRRSVTIPARLGFGSTWRSFRQRANERIADALGGVLRRIASGGR